MIRSRRGLIATCVLTITLGLVTTLPARIAIAWFVPANIPISGIQGSVWNGSAKEANVSGIYLRDIHWRLNKLRSLTGKLSFRIDASPVSGFFESDLSVGFNGGLSVSALPLALFAEMSDLPGLRGTATLDFERLKIVDGLAVVADGSIQVADLIVPLVSRDSLGGYKAEFFTQANGISASVEDTNGVLDLAGSLQVRTDRSYEFLALVIAKSDTPKSVRDQLRFLPPANDRGQRELRLEGIL